MAFLRITDNYAFETLTFFERFRSSEYEEAFLSWPKFVFRRSCIEILTMEIVQ